MTSRVPFQVQHCSRALTQQRGERHKAYLALFRTVAGCWKLLSRVVHRVASKLSKMGWFSSKKEQEPEPALRKDRQKCWETRDAYFTCLDATGVLKPGDEGRTCSSSKTLYEQNCAKSWVRRSYQLSPSAFIDLSVDRLFQQATCPS